MYTGTKYFLSSKLISFRMPSEKRTKPNPWDAALIPYLIFCVVLSDCRSDKT